MLSFLKRFRQPDKSLLTNPSPKIKGQERKEWTTRFRLKYAKHNLSHHRKQKDPLAQLCVPMWEKIVARIEKQLEEEKMARKKAKAAKKEETKTESVSTTVVSLAELEAGESGRITYIKPENHANLHQLLSFGLQPGVTVTVHRKTPALCIMFENTELALDGDIARNIFVWKASSAEA